ncbi:hypothetical protein TELCIR_01522 [Teladorsagia circumcincta]|uniref:FHF complex subunit HOOK-interacting protein C-terminal domain-containing protein n=1 Tax=Teladorsagia circumcincta TaxID=45464 RepID=A0A2G9V200_TELCI|nr:hypothetical protein TELCIR_01522 [Teladorsagia circumcincta]
MSDHSLAFNLQLANVLCSLAAYPQPLLVASIFNTNANSKVPDLLKVLSKLKKRVDAAASSIEGLDVYVGRALRTLNGRAEKMERHFDGYITRYHSHKAIESEAAARDDAATKNIVHAAIVMANLCQFLAGIALQQSVVVVTNSAR